MSPNRAQPKNTANSKEMLQCISFKSSSSSSQTANNVNSIAEQSQGNSVDGTPRSGSQLPSPTMNLSWEYMQAMKSSSYNEMWSKIHVFDPNNEDGHDGQEEELMLEHVLQPNRQCVEEALSLARDDLLTRLVSCYFNHSEKTSQLCVLLYHRVHRARDLYASLYKLLDVLPFDEDISQSQCDRAFDIFLEFDLPGNPFPCPESPDSHNFGEVNRGFSQLKLQLDQRLTKSRSKIRLLRNATTGSAICFVGTVVGVAVSATLITAHALGLLVAAAPLCASCSVSKFAKRELAHVAQLDAASRGTYVMINELDTIDRLVTLLYTAIESDKLLVRIVLERGRDKHPIREVLKQLHKNRVSFLDHLNDLENRICLYFATINRARSLLLQKIINTHSKV